eukprot:tig00020510_g9830.t1
MSLTAYLETRSYYLLQQQMMGAENPPGVFSNNVDAEGRQFSRTFDCMAMQIPPEVYEAVKKCVARRGIEAGKAVIDAARKRDPSIGGGADKLSPAARRRLEDELKARKDQWLAASLAAINQVVAWFVLERKRRGFPKSNLILARKAAAAARAAAAAAPC